MRVGFDIGGTFTDVTILDDTGRPQVRKVLSLLDRVAGDIADCVTEHGGAGASVDAFIHGTTIASNAVIEGTTAKTGLLTTRGFRDELEMRGQRRPNIYDAAWNRLPALVSRHLRIELDERILGDGSIERPLDPESARRAIDRLLAEPVEAVAVSLLNAYLRSDHEREVGALLAECAPDIPVCLSSDIHPEIREYERTSTTVINASLVPVVTRYLDDLESRLRTFSERLLVMQSNGGIMSSDLARERPALMIESGPAAGVLAASRLAGENEWPAVLSFDMGGTTAKACLIEDGVPLERPGGEVGAGATMTTRLFGGGGHALRAPWLDIVEVGAGGGSIAWIEDGGALRVGPRSAGAAPGPVCYGRGGEEPTVTDANVVLGYVNPGAIAGDTLSIDADAAAGAIEAHVAKPLGLSLADAAYGIVQVANATMMRALRAVSTERGRDPRAFALVPFGGAGPMHAATLADSLGVREIRVPPYPGLFSALGLLLADYRHDYVRSIATALESLRPAEVAERCAEMEALARSELLAEGAAPESIRFERRADLRFGYQVSELSLPLPAVDDDFLVTLEAQFRDAHLREFGYEPDDTIELVNVRLRATAPASATSFRDLALARAGDPPASEGAASAAVREAYFGPEHGHLPTPVLSRPDLATERAGPLIVEEPDTTVVVPPGWRGVLDRGGNLALRAAS